MSQAIKGSTQGSAMRI